MDKKKAGIFLIPLLFAFLLILPENVFAEQVGDVEIINGKQHKILAFNPDGTKKMLMSSWDRWIVDHYDQNNKPVYTEYKLTQNANQTKVETPQGSIVFYKNYCSFAFFGKGIIDETGPNMFSDSIVSKKATVGSNTWTNIDSINNAACNTVIKSNETSISISAIKNKNSVGSVNYEYIYNLGKWKTQLTAFNNSTATDQKFGFTQTIDRNSVFIKFGNQTIDLRNFNGTTFDRNWIDSHQAKLVNFMNGYNFDFDLAFSYLKQITVYAYANGKSKLVFDYTNNDVPLLPQQKLVLDPTYSSTSGGLFANMASDDTQRFGIYTKEASSVLVGIDIDSITWYLKKTGSPTGSAYAKVYNNAGTLLYTFATTLDTSTLTASSVGYTFSGSTTLATDDRLVFEYTGGGGANAVAMEYANPGSFDTTNTILTLYNGAAWSDTPTYNAYDTKFDIVYNTTPEPDAVDDLTATATSKTTIFLDYTEPDLHGETLIGYQINYTTPYGTPLTIYTNNTASSTSEITLSGLIACTQYSARVSAWTAGGNNATGNIANATTACYTTPAAPTLSATAESDTAIRFTSVNGTTGDYNIKDYALRCEINNAGGWLNTVSNSTVPDPRVYIYTGLTTADTITCQWRDGSAAGWGPYSNNATSSPELPQLESQRPANYDRLTKLAAWFDSMGGVYMGMSLFPFLVMMIGLLAGPRTTHIFTIITLCFMGIIHASGYYVYPDWFWTLSLLFGLVIVLARKYV